MLIWKNIKKCAISNVQVIKLKDKKISQDVYDKKIYYSHW